MRPAVMLWAEKDHNYIIVIVIRKISYLHLWRKGKKVFVFSHYATLAISDYQSGNICKRMTNIWHCRRTVHKVYIILYIKTTLALFLRDRSHIYYPNHCSPALFSCECVTVAASLQFTG